jgi:hypothetical protein
MNRREFVAVLGGATFAEPLRAQQSKTPKIGVLTLLENAEPFPRADSACRAETFDADSGGRHPRK